MQNPIRRIRSLQWRPDAAQFRTLLTPLLQRLARLNCRAGRWRTPFRLRVFTASACPGSLKRQLLWCLAGFLALFAVASGTVIWGLAGSAARFEQFMDSQLLLQSQMQAAYAQGLQMGQALRNILLDPANSTAYGNLTKAQTDFGGELTKAAATAGRLGAFVDDVRAIQDLHQRQLTVQQALLESLRSSGRPEAERILNQQETPLWREMKKVMQDTLSALDAASQIEKREVESQAGHFIWAGLALSLVTALFVAGGGYLVFRRVFRVLGGEPDEVARLARAVAEGDLSGGIPVGTDSDSLMASMGRMTAAVRGLAHEMHGACSAVIAGRLSERADAGAQLGEYRTVLQEFNDTLDAVTEPLRTAAVYVDRIAHGDIPDLITNQCQGEFDLIRNNLNTCIGAIGRMRSDVQRLTCATLQGELATRADADSHGGVYREIVGGFNDTLDAVMGPLGTTADYVARIARGDIPPRIEDEFKGDFRIVKDNLNAAIDNVNALVVDARLLAKAAVEGDLSVRADAGRHHGDYRRIVEGVNDTLDAIVRPIEEIMVVLGALAQGDLTREINAGYQGTFATLRDDVNATVRNLGVSVRSIKEATDAIHDAAREIARGSGELSERIEEQASGLEQTAASMDALAETVRRNAEDAGQANEMANTASVVAGTGGTIIHKVMETMEEIDASSRKVVDIISVIDGIAFQTNILALNAAVEAARAGEHGRGFAVVAAEVRSLAQRAAAAAKEIKKLINESVKKVEGGAKLERETGQTMDEIVGSVRRVNDIIANIAEASEAQSKGIEQVNKAVSRMGVVTQQNTALVEMTAMSADSLEQQVAALSDLVARFRVDEGAALSVSGIQEIDSPGFEQNAVSPTPVSTDDDDWSKF